MNVRSIEDISKLSYYQLTNLENILNWLDEVQVLKGSAINLNKIREALVMGYKGREEWLVSDWLEYLI